MAKESKNVAKEPIEPSVSGVGPSSKMNAFQESKGEQVHTDMEDLGREKFVKSKGKSKAAGGPSRGMKALQATNEGRHVHSDTEDLGGDEDFVTTTNKAKADAGPSRRRKALQATNEGGQVYIDTEDLGGDEEFVTTKSKTKAGAGPSHGMKALQKPKKGGQVPIDMEVLGGEEDFVKTKSKVKAGAGPSRGMKALQEKLGGEEEHLPPSEEFVKSGRAMCGAGTRRVKRNCREEKRQRSASPGFSHAKKIDNSRPQREVVFYCNTHVYVKEYMAEVESDDQLMDFTIMAKDGLIKTNQVFLYSVVGAQAFPMLEETFIELDADVAVVKFILHFLYSNQEISESFSDVSLLSSKKNCL